MSEPVKKNDPRCPERMTYVPGGYSEVGKTADGAEYVKSPHTTSSEALECRPEDAICTDDYEGQCTEDRTIVYTKPFCMFTPATSDFREYLNKYGLRQLPLWDKPTDERKVKREVKHPETRGLDFRFRTIAPQDSKK